MEMFKPPRSGHVAHEHEKDSIQEDWKSFNVDSGIHSWVSSFFTIQGKYENKKASL